MGVTLGSILISSKKEYSFRLEMDDIKGIIRLTKNKIGDDFTRITNRNIPIVEQWKWKFHRDRTGYSNLNSSEYNFIGSYIDRKKSPNKYLKWKNFILTKYKLLKQETREESK